MEANATKANLTRPGIRGLFRGSDLSIRLRLIVCFVSIVLLMIVADAIAVWQYRQIEVPAERARKADHAFQNVVRVHLDVDTSRDTMVALGSSHDARQFADRTTSIRREFLKHVDQAEQALEAGPEIEQDANISNALETLQITLLSQLDTAVQLATDGDWNAIQLRLTNQIPALIEFSSSLVERVDQQALHQRSIADEDSRTARQRFFKIVPIAALLTLLAAAALGWYVTRAVTGPLSLLTAGAEALARGDFQHKVHLDGNNELAVLGNAFNYAAQQLQKLYEDVRRLYEDVRRSERELREVINTVPAHVWSASPDGTVDFVNERLLKFVGLSSDDISGWNWESVIHSDDRAKFVTDWRAALNDGQSIESEIRMRRADGQHRWFFVRNVPLRDEAGNVTKWYGSGIEIEDLKRTEEERERLRQVQSELAHIHRVTTMGELSASLAHEIKQPIAATITSASSGRLWLERDPPNLDKALAALKRIEKDGNRAAKVIDHLRSLYKKAPPQREAVAVNEVIAEMASMLRGEANRYAASIRTDLAADLPMVMADRVQLQQVLMNLMLNSIEAMHDTGGVLTVSSELSKDGQVLISVSDTGVGLPIEKDHKIFDAFFTTKAQGSGMGLAISRSIVESHGGRLWATANDGRGATFQFTLPVAIEGTSVSAAEVRSGVSQAAGE